MIAAGPATRFRRPSVPDDWRIEPLFAASLDDPGRPGTHGTRGGALPPALAARYRADLAFALRVDRSTIVANFVSTLDGVVAFDTRGASGGSEVSGGFAPDRFLMGLLRATADAVLVGAGTVRSGSGHVWSPGHVSPASATAYAAWRRALGLRPQPTTVIVSASGDINPAHPGLNAPDVPVAIVTTADGARRVGLTGLPPGVEVVATADGAAIDTATIVDVLRSRQLHLVLCEGGPTLFAQLLGAGLVDELFLTMAPQLAGRAPSTPRLALVEGVGFDVDAAPWADLVAVMRADDHLFLRYRLAGSDSGRAGADADPAREDGRE